MTTELPREPTDAKKDAQTLKDQVAEQEQQWLERFETQEKGMLTQHKLFEEELKKNGYRNDWHPKPPVGVAFDSPFAVCDQGDPLLEAEGPSRYSLFPIQAGPKGVIAETYEGYLKFREHDWNEGKGMLPLRTCFFLRGLRHAEYSIM